LCSVSHTVPPAFPTRRSSDLDGFVPPLSPDLLEDLGRAGDEVWKRHRDRRGGAFHGFVPADHQGAHEALVALRERADNFVELGRSEEHTSELQSRENLVCRLL